MKNKKIKYFYINLDKDTKRKEHIENVFKKHKIPSERFSAIDGEIYKGINKGSRACRDTHLALWKKIKKDEIFIIFEDDITISENKFEEIISKLPTENWNILNFGPTEVDGVAHGKPNLIAIQSPDGNNHILDGHHRWSSAWISGGPGAKIRVQALKGLNIPVAIAALRSYGNARDNPQKG